MQEKPVNKTAKLGGKSSTKLKLQNVALGNSDDYMNCEWFEIGHISLIGGQICSLKIYIAKHNSDTLYPSTN